MSLLQELMDRPLDPSYAAAADRREAAGLPRSTSTRGPVVIVSALLIGFLLVAAALALRPSGTTASRDKEQLIQQVQARQARGDELAAQASSLSGEIQNAQAAALAAQATQLGAELDRLELLTGEVAVAGPGLVLTVDDAPAARANRAAGDPRDANGFPKGRVTSFDLQILCNGLWQAGAEAMSINGQRLTSRSAIRFAGDAILVDYKPLSPPYVITAVGEGRDLQTGFATTSSGPYLKSLGDNYAIPSTIATAGPGRRAPQLVGLLGVRATRAHRHTLGLAVRRPRRNEGTHVMIPAIGLLVGVVAGLLLHPSVPVSLQPYLPIAVIAALDAVFGGVRAVLDGIFVDKVFVVSFLSNVVVAAFIVFLGDQLGVGTQLSTGVVVVLGVRIFSNVASIRRHLFKA